MQISPVTIQAYVPGTNIRTYVIGNQVYSAEIRSGAMDFREDQAAELVNRDLPEEIQKLAISIREALYLEWTAIDWRLTPEGKYVFLEANPSPMFVYFEKQSNFPITESLIQLLTR